MWRRSTGGVGWSVASVSPRIASGDATSGWEEVGVEMSGQEQQRTDVCEGEGAGP